jgi:CheY-like chemotaxis protein
MSLRVLVVDDEPDVRFLLRVQLERRGFDVDLVSSGEEALAYTDTGSCDVIVLDLRMPGLNGLEVARRLHGRWPIILYSAYVDPDVSREAGALGLAVVDKSDVSGLVGHLESMRSRGTSVSESDRLSG